MKKKKFAKRKRKKHGLGPELNYWLGLCQNVMSAETTTIKQDEIKIITKITIIIRRRRLRRRHEFNLLCVYWSPIHSHTSCLLSASAVLLPSRCCYCCWRCCTSSVTFDSNTIAKFYNECSPQCQSTKRHSVRAYVSIETHTVRFNSLVSKVFCAPQRQHTIEIILNFFSEKVCIVALRFVFLMLMLLLLLSLPFT